MTMIPLTVSILPCCTSPELRQDVIETYSAKSINALLKAFAQHADWDAAGHLIDILYAGRILVNEFKHLRKREDSGAIDGLLTDGIQIVLNCLYLTNDARHGNAKEFKFTKKELDLLADARDVFVDLCSWVRTIDVSNAVHKADARRTNQKQCLLSLMAMGDRNYRKSKQWFSEK